MPRAGTEVAASGVRCVGRGGRLRAHGLVALRAQPRVVGGNHAELRQQRQPSARRQVRALLCAYGLAAQPMMPNAHAAPVQLRRTGVRGTGARGIQVGFVGYL